MDKLYALLVILIVIYIGINLGSPLLGFDNGNTTDNVTDVVDENLIHVGASTIPKIDNFTDNAVNDTTISLVDENKGMTINVSEIDNSQGIGDIAGNYYNNYPHTSNQTIDQNGVTTYFLYNEVSEYYSSDIFFNKNGQNYCISGDNIPYADSDYFINHCKGIIDTINITSTS
ncbi:hypothetical protein [Methanobrevibacter sp.]|uniref:hypothetical protein n=1 Tax=Methanobrevibacter sp. TaxID=66852 RepID=UPI003864308E